MDEAFHSDSTAWTSAITRACSAVGTSAFGEAMLRAANVVVPVDQCWVYTFHRRAPSDCLLIAGKGNLQHAARMAEDWLSDGYRADPYLHYLQAGTPQPVVIPYSPRDLPRSFRTHFIDSQGIVDDVACAASRGDRTVYCGFFRLAPNAGYAESERRMLERVLPVLASLAAVHRTLFGPFLPCEPPAEMQPPPDEVQDLQQRMARSPFDDLTDREREVCFRILLGYSSEAIGLHLGVATTTVKTFRRRAYEKLGIVSQAELFFRYLRSLPSSTSALS